ncbi:MAG: hypothetical protein HKN16_06010, partial [Saprospiraceae bacterium]|nr:hypothetical protein [Saprospiraceae bacterium]
RAPGRAPRFAENIEVDINPLTHGQWEEMGDRSIWRLVINSPGALSLNLGFTRYHMPEEGTFVIYDPKKSRVLGPFTPSDNEVHNQLWTPIFEGDEMILEVVVPTETKEGLAMQLSFINHDYMGFGRMLSGSCNLDVNCSEADGWGIVDGYRDIIRSVAVIGTGGGTFCTGFLINNVRNDASPYFMTANHCGIDFGSSPSLVAYWNYENSTCRQPNSAASGQNGNGSLNTFNTGSVFKTASANSDVVLVEFDDPIHPDAGAYLAGFSLDPNPPQDTTIAIHHPSTDEKRISFEFDLTHIGAWGSGDAVVPGGDHIVVPDWDIGTTEGGSSGSPLFDKNKRVVGQLHGGGAACGNDLYDSYGWFYSSWTLAGLDEWLDPDGTGVTEIDGLDLDFNIILDQNIASFCAPQDQVFEIAVSDNFEGPVSLSLSPDPPQGVSYSFSNDAPSPGETVSLTFTNTDFFPGGNYFFSIDATDGQHPASSGITLQVFESLMVSPSLVSPLDGVMDASTNSIYSWDPISNAQLYDFQISLDSTFTSILETITDIEGNSTNGPNLNILSTYYWRVRAVNACGTTEWSQAFALNTANILCSTTPYSGGPVGIPTNTAIVEASQMVESQGLIADIRITDVQIQHSYVGDLILTLISPSGTEVVLVDRIGVPESGYGCGNENLLLAFDDQATATSEELENLCDSNPAAAGTFQPVESLSAFGGESADGTWTLRVEDAADFDGGEIVNFTLDICATIPI